MTAVDVQAIAESASALVAVGAVTAWFWQLLRHTLRWRRKRRAKRVRDDAFPLVATCIAAAALLAWLARGGDS